MTRRDNDLLSACYENCPWLRAAGWIGFIALLGISLAHIMGWI